MEAEKLKAMVTKTVNKKIEVEMRHRAVEGKINISKAQEAVVKYHKLQKTQADSDTASQSTIT
jgi:exoribonuclease R